MGSVIKSVIFDCFGVLAVDSWLPFKDEYFGYDQKLIETATDLNKKANSGLISNAEFIEEIARLAGLTPKDVSRQIGRNPANRPLFKHIAKDLKGRYKLGVLSNASTDWTNRLFTPDQLSLFDAIILSYQIGYVKPDPRAYRAITQKLDSIPQECVFVDNQERYCEAARQAGMQAVWYRDFKQFKEDFDQIISHS